MQELDYLKLQDLGSFSNKDASPTKVPNLVTAGTNCSWFKYIHSVGSF